MKRKLKILTLIIICTMGFQFHLSGQTTHNPLWVDIALRYKNHKEIKPNRSPFIDSANKYVGSRFGSPYCQASVSLWLHLAGNPYALKTGLARNFKIKGRSFRALDVLLGKVKVENGDIITWGKGETIYGHAGMAIEDWTGKKGMTIQANTKKSAQSREGDGIYVKSAEIQPYNYFRIIRITKVKTDEKLLFDKEGRKYESRPKHD